MEQILNYLKTQGMSNSQIEEFLISLNNIVAEQVYKKILLELPEEDIKYLESLPKDEFDKALIQKYQAVSGKTPQQLAQQILATLTTSIQSQTRKEE